MKEIDIEEAPVPNSLEASKGSNWSLVAWITANVLATTAIVYVNKLIFTDPSFGRCPLGFAAFHFFITTLLLYFASRPRVRLFVPVRTSVLPVLPLTLIMCANVVFLNLSLAYSSILFYQVVRILLTPLTVIINFCFYGSKIPVRACLALLPTCIGVGIVSYYDSSVKSKKATVETTSALGMVFSFTGVTISAVYTLWVSQYHKKLQMDSMQLLYNQVPFGTLLLFIASLFTETFPVWGDVLPRQWILLVISGACACIVNLSLFFIIDHAGPVSSTVTGHLKTCIIVGLGWALSEKIVGFESKFGILLSILGIILYSFAMHNKSAKGSQPEKSREDEDMNGLIYEAGGNQARTPHDPPGNPHIRTSTLLLSPPRNSEIQHFPA
ncbi:integral membrane protein [Histoplasma capsulatum]|uniref:GDP-mannose transporter n=1 Tax=Ajellomyces capsulatus TaxID=5037 RepID=A0A8A1M019_AJECA|nr:integral membrane protein [Histoplasma capsulatum]